MIKPILDKDITFVLQGPVAQYDGRSMSSDITSQAIAKLRELFPQSPIILSTWKGQDVEHLDADKVLLHDDPGSNVVYVNGEKQTLNNNRQLVSTHRGLCAVETPYAVKLRTDNMICSRQFVDVYQACFDIPRDSEAAVFKQRVLTSSVFFTKYHYGQDVYYHKSDLFDFGLTEDLLKIWPETLVPELEFFPSDGYKSHYPLTEQFLTLHWLNPLVQRSLFVHNKANDTGGAEESFWRTFVANNLIVEASENLGLTINERFTSRKRRYNEWTHLDWLKANNAPFSATKHIGLLLQRAPEKLRSVFKV